MSSPPDAPQPAPQPAPETAAPPEPSGGREVKPNRTLWAVLAAIAVIVVVALAVVLTRGEPAPLAESSPAGVVQRYAAAVIAGDEGAASAYLTAAARNRCGSDVAPAARNLRVTLVSTTERPDSADVRVLITVSEPGGPFGSSEYQIEDVFDLVRSGDGWLIDNAPWQLRVCPGPVKQ